MVARLRPKYWIAAAVAVSFAAIAGGCGVRGPLDPPPGAQAAGEVRAPDAADPGSTSVAPPKPHEPFVLDPLLR